MEESFRSHERIKKKQEFLFLYKKGLRYRGNYLKIIYFPNELEHSRAGIVVGKKIGNASRRNYIKRIMRALFRRNKNLLNKNIDVLLIPEKNIHNASWSLLQKEYKQALEFIFNKDLSL